MGSFLFRWPHVADHVYVTGTFDDWGKSERLDKVGDVFEKEVELPSADHKVLYKFVVDDDWIVDHEAPQEDDGHYNINNVLLPSQIKPITRPAAAATTSTGDSEASRPRGHRVLSTSSAPPGSNGANALAEAPTVSAGSDGAPLLTKEQSEANLARWIPHVVPAADRPVTRSLPQTEAATVSAGGEGAPLLTKEQSEANLAREIPHVVPAADRPVTRAIPQTDGAAASQSESTLSKTAEEEQELPGTFPETLPEHPDTSHSTSALPQTREEDQALPGAFPETPAYEPDSFSVTPLPATGHDNTQSSVTTSKEDYENAGGEGTAGGLVSAPSLPATGHTDTQSSITTSKEDFDNAGGEGTAGGDFSVNPIPATGQKDIQGGVTISKEDFENSTGGEGTAGGVFSALPIPAEGQKDIGSSATTSKEDYEKVGVAAPDNQEVSVNPLPATGHQDLQSSITTSKEDYEKAGAFGTAGVLAGAGVGAGLFSALSKPKANDRNIIPESSLPMNSEELDTMDRGPFLNSAGPGTTTADLASRIPLEPKREAQVVDSQEAPDVVKEASSTPFISSAGPGTTTGDLAAKVPLEPKREAEVEHSSSSPFISSVGTGATSTGLASAVPLEPKRDAQVSDATPFLQSSGPGTTTADLASQVPLEQKRQGQVFDADDLAGAVPGTARDGPEATAPAAIVAEKAALEEELLQKVPESQAKGAPASAAKAQTSYYGLATSVPEPVEKSIAKAQTSPEAATEPSAVAEKSAVERELQAKVPVVESAGEPAPTISASTASTAPNVTSTSPTSPSTQVPGTSPFAAAQVSDGSGLETPGTEEPPRIAPPVEKTEADATDYAPPRAAGIAPGVSASAAAALSDGTEDPTLVEDDTSETPVTKVQVPVETSEATATEYAPPQAPGIAPGVSPSAAAALSDGTEDPTLNEDATSSGAMASDSTVKGKSVDPIAQAVAAPAATVHDKVTDVSPGKASSKTGFTQNTFRDVPAKSSLSQGTMRSDPARLSTTEAGVTRSKSFMAKLGAGGSSAPSTPKKGTSSGGVTSDTAASTTSTPQSTPGSTKKRHRLSQMIKKIFD